MISLLLPSRLRPNNIIRLHGSAFDLAKDPDDIEMVVVIDDDDTSYDFIREAEPKNVKWVVTQRRVLSEYWNIACENASGPIYMHCGDDIVFRTQDWDAVVKETFDRFSDKIVFAYGADGTSWDDEAFGTHGFIHQNWVDAVGYFVPPYFSSDYNDVWLNEVAKAVGRHERIPIFTEHMHWVVGKGELDIVHQERLERHDRDNVAQIYADRVVERVADADKLRAVMGER